MEQDNRNKEVFKVVKGVLDVAHQVHKAEMATKDARNALLSEDRDIMIATIGKYVNKYERFINATTWITGVWTHRTPGFYDDKSLDYIKNDLERSIAIVYFKTAVDNGLESAIKKALKKKLGIDELVLDELSFIS